MLRDQLFDSLRMLVCERLQRLNGLRMRLHFLGQLSTQRREHVFVLGRLRLQCLGMRLLARCQFFLVLLDAGS